MIDAALANRKIQRLYKDYERGVINKETLNATVKGVIKELADSYIKYGEYMRIQEELRYGITL